MSKGLRTLGQAIALFRDLDPLAPVTTVLAFLHIASTPDGDLSMADLKNLLGAAKSTASRSVAYLGKTHRLGKPGMNLVEDYYTDGRSKSIKLNPKGRALAARLSQLMEP